MNTTKPRMPDVTLVQIAGRIARLGGWIADLPSERVFWSNEVCDILEVPHGTYPTIAEALAYYPPAWAPGAKQMFDACVADGTGFDEEMQVVSAAGTCKWVRVTAEAVYGEAGAVARLQGAFQDITEFKHADSHRRMLANRLTTTLESITDAVVMVDREWRFTFINRTAERLLQCPRDEVLGMSIWERFPEAVGGPYHTEYQRAIRENCSVSFVEHYAPLKLWTEIRAYPSDEGLAIYFLDISERMAAEAKIHALAYFDKLTGLPNE